MGTPFYDITLYSPTSYSTGTSEYWEERALQNYICDLYVQSMHGYKPPNTTRVTIQPGFYGIWDRTWKNGSIVSIAVAFDYEKYKSLDKQGKYRYVLNVVQDAMRQLSDEYHWEKTVIEKAYNEIIDQDFSFIVSYPAKTSRDKKKLACIGIEKTETVTTITATIQANGQSLKVKLLDKKNWWWYDSAYQLAKGGKWFDNDKFGIAYKPANLNVWYSLMENTIYFEKDGNLHQDLKLDKLFNF